MNNLDRQYKELLQTILDYGVVKKDRTGTGTKSIFGYTIRHKMSEGFPLLTSKKMAWDSVVFELLWFLRGDTNIQYLVKNDCNIWNGDVYKRYSSNQMYDVPNTDGTLKSIPVHNLLSKKEFVEKIKTDDEFAKKWGDLGPIYGSQWRRWDEENDELASTWTLGGNRKGIDQIQNLIDDLKNNPDSRRLMVTAWNPTDLPNQVLPPCHYGFQCYTKELTLHERIEITSKHPKFDVGDFGIGDQVTDEHLHEVCDLYGTPKRSLSLMWNQRSVDTFLGLPFNIASYGLLLTMLAWEVNMVPDELIGSLGDTHLYLNHLDKALEQIGVDLTLEERFQIWFDEQKPHRFIVETYEKLDISGKHKFLDNNYVPRKSRHPYPLPKISIQDGIYCSSLEDVKLIDYRSHSAIKADLSN